MISFHLAPDLLSSLAAEGIAVHVSMYPCPDDEQEVFGGWGENSLGSIVASLERCDGR